MNDLRSELISLEMLPKNMIKNISSRNGQYKTFIAKDVNTYGVAIMNPNNNIVNEKFLNVYIKNMEFTISDMTLPVLYLFTNNDIEIIHFVFLAESFLEISNENTIIEEPLLWIEQWKNMLGDSKKRYKVYDVIGELITLNYCLEKKQEVHWQASQMGVHDIESEHESIEVKSSIKRSETRITINSAFQLFSEKQEFLYYCRFESNPMGTYSINSLSKKIAEAGYNIDKLEMELSKLGYPKGISTRENSFNLIEFRKYKIEKETFPQISLEKINELSPKKNIVSYTIELDLSGIQYKNII
ncbi:PD-(D/E)XK motif protein [Mycoplasmatota bacterium]|nr:PD-(D/E)XK motif protein [Mycoplasmatota bacterium]